MVRLVFVAVAVAALLAAMSSADKTWICDVGELDQLDDDTCRNWRSI